MTVLIVGRDTYRLIRAWMCLTRKRTSRFWKMKMRSQHPALARLASCDSVVRWQAPRRHGPSFSSAFIRVHQRFHPGATNGRHRGDAEDAEKKVETQMHHRNRSGGATQMDPRVGARGQAQNTQMAPQRWARQRRCIIYSPLARADLCNLWFEFYARHRRRRQRRADGVPLPQPPPARGGGA